MIEPVVIEPFIDEGLGHSAYLAQLGDDALVVDPPRFPPPRMFEAARRTTTVVADTHTHADYVSGGPELSAAGAVFMAPRDANLAVAHTPIDAAETVALSERFWLRPIATPGHTPDHLAYLLQDGETPVALFSGGSLMVGTVGRTDLFGREHAGENARQLYRSLITEILPLPDDLPVYPTHGAGSFCSAPGAADRTTTIGRERRTNPLLVDADEETFVARVVRGLDSFPTYYARLPALNRRGARLFGGNVPTLPAVGIDAARRMIAENALLVDARDITRFAAGHVPSSLSNALRPVFGSWLAWLVEPGRPIIFVLDPDQDRRELVRQALTVGVERIIGELDGGFDAWADAGLPVATTSLVQPDDLAGTLVDVRQRTEFESGHVPSAHNIELAAIATTTLPTGPLTMMCGHGERAMTAASIALDAGTGDVRVVAGGPVDWATRTGRHLVSAQ
jgi:hydroxyacylglutathione hydrolase